MVNYLSIDYESWVYPDLPEFQRLTSDERKRLDQGYIKKSTRQILNLLAKHKTKLTFFVLGELYDWYPEVIEAIAAAGHEIGYHTHTHEILDSEKKLTDSLAKSKNFLRKFKPKGFRAPAISIKAGHFPILKEHGFIYDSSVYGSTIPPYGGGWSRSIVEAAGRQSMVELPVSKVRGLPIGSGYFTALFRQGIGCFYKLLNCQDLPVVSFIHNWQIVKPCQASFPSKSYLLKNPHYFPYTLEVRAVFEFLLKRFSFMPMINLAKEKKRR